MLYLTCTTITSVDLAHYGVSRAKDWVSGDCGKNSIISHNLGTQIPINLVLFSAALVQLAKSIPVHSLIVTPLLFFYLPLLLFPSTVPCRIVFAKSEDLETWPENLSFRVSIS